MRLLILITGCVGFMAIPRLIRPPANPLRPPAYPAPTLAYPLRPPAYSTEVQSAIRYFQTESQHFATSCTDLRQSLAALQPGDHSLTTPHPRDNHSLTIARQKLIACRRHYKKIESFLEYFFRSSSTVYNRPPKFEAEDGSMEYQSPIGLQFIESLLYEPRLHKKELLAQAQAVESSAADLPALLYDLKADDRQLLESLRIELIRVMALDITGYEAPLLKSGIPESAEALRSLSVQLQPYWRPGEPRSDSLRDFLEKAIAMTDSSNSFDAFDRLGFLTAAALPLQRQLGLFIRERGLELNTNKALNYDAPDLFSPDALLPEHFPSSPTPKTPAPGTPDLSTVNPGPPTPDPSTQTLLGQRLFTDSTLSGNGRKSCASCHNPEKMFTDRLPLSVAFDGHQHLDRNAPTLLYSGFQYSQFWDGRAYSLEDQIRTVLHDAREMNADTATLQKKTGLATSRIVAAIAAYVRSLHPMNSAFDRYMQGNTHALNTREKSGANLFMGKAQCATCHFIPLFNGLIPPDYALTEFEVLGTTRTDRLDQPQLSKDVGRYTIYPFPFFKGAFKTPTVRNAAQTYPYMHNGAFHDLKKLMEFYNKGGGAGLRLPVPNQTLSSLPLHLSPGQIDDIILFIRSLTDSLTQKS